LPSEIKINLRYSRRRFKEEVMKVIINNYVNLLNLDGVCVLCIPCIERVSGEF
jgi:hypothetical protein